MSADIFSSLKKTSTSQFQNFFRSFKMKTNLILIRHGFSIANEANVFAGFYDIDLTPTGLRQAEHCAAYLRNEHIDAVY
ncbi:MAG: histidine phosphatase family protein, partial [Lachnospiraceae bacterium]|nr:histidine phosphatase family protein [Lachnospiraceae bacterium]